MILFINFKCFDLGQDLKVEPELPRYPFFFNRHDEILTRTLNNLFLPTFMYRPMLSDAKKLIWPSGLVELKTANGLLANLILLSFQSGKKNYWKVFM